jgi:hypothetical protein
MAFYLGGYCICCPAKKKNVWITRTDKRTNGQLTIKYLNIQSGKKKWDNLNKIDAAEFSVNTILKISDIWKELYQTKIISFFLAALQLPSWHCSSPLIAFQLPGNAECCPE